MVRTLGIIVTVSLAILWGCNEKDNPAGVTNPTSVIYLGSLNDTVLGAIFTQAHMNYAGTQYRYTLTSDNTFKVDENVGMGWTSPSGEEGTYAVNGTTYTFTPIIDRRDSQNPPGTMAPSDSLRPVYTGVLNDSLTITNFINIDNKSEQRNLGTLVLKRQ